MNRLDRMTVRFTVAAASWQVFVVKFLATCARFFFYHEALFTIPNNLLIAFGKYPAIQFGINFGIFS